MARLVRLECAVVPTEHVNTKQSLATFFQRRGGGLAMSCIHTLTESQSAVTGQPTPPRAPVMEPTRSEPASLMDTSSMLKGMRPAIMER